MNWSDEQTISFIEMYRDRPVLWRSSDPEYKNRNKRHDALIEIAVSFGIEKQDVEKKLKIYKASLQESGKERSSREQLGQVQTKRTTANGLHTKL